MSAEQYRNELDQLHASPELKARLAALQRETPPAAKPPKLRLAKRAGTSVVAAAACLMLCVAVWRGEMLSGKGGFSAADASRSSEAAEYSTQMDEAMMEAAAPESGTETAAAENPEAAAADGAADAGQRQRIACLCTHDPAYFLAKRICLDGSCRNAPVQCLDAGISFQMSDLLRCFSGNNFSTGNFYRQSL